MPALETTRRVEAPHGSCGNPIPADMLAGIDMTARVAPSRIMVAATRKAEPVVEWIAHVPGSHPPGCPIRADLVALEMRTKAGSRWQGVVNAWIDSKLRMIAQGMPKADELTQKWKAATGRLDSMLASRHTIEGFDEFTSAYLECALFCGIEFPEDHPDSGRDKNYHADPEAIDPNTLAAMAKDCARFRTPEIVAALDRAEESGMVDVIGKAGRDFWYTRNGHGVGFWETDRWPSEESDILDKAARAFGEVDLYAGDDGRIYA